NSADEYLPRISPDGKWVAYISDTGMGYEVFVSPIPGAGAPSGERHQISTGAGREGPVWGPSGLVLYYRVGGRVLETRLKVTPQFETATDTLFTDVFVHGNGYTDFDTRDGKRFLMMRSIDEQQRLVVVTGWLDVLRDRMSQGARK